METLFASPRFSLLFANLGEMETGKKSPPYCLISDDLFDISPEIPIKEELVEEFMQELYREITTSGSATKFPPSPEENCNILASPPSFFAGSNGKSESCSAFVSDTWSTVVTACVEFASGSAGSVSGGNGVSVGDGGSVKEAVVGRLEEGMDGCDGVEVDDEWLARVLSWGPSENDAWF